MALRLTEQPQQSIFETRFIGHLQSFVSAAPPNVLTLQTDAQSDYVIFKMIPSNPKSAAIQGEASTQGGITFTVGRASKGELSTVRDEFFFEMCEAVFTSHLTEYVVQSTSGRILATRIILIVNGKKLRLGGSQMLWWLLFPKRQTKVFEYEPCY
jgi:hypothetical protein